MRESDKAKINALFTAYNEELSRQYDDVLQSFPRIPASNEEQDKIYSFVQAGIQAWLAKPFIYEGTSLTPAGIIAAIDDSADAFMAVQAAARICDDGIPPFVRESFKNHQNELQRLAAEYIIAADWNEIDEIDYPETALICSALIQLLTEWGYRSDDLRFLEKLEISAKPAELITDALRRHLRWGGREVLDRIIGMISSFCHLEYIRSAKRDVLMLLLVEIARDSGDTDAYRCLRSCFINSRDKVFAAICLADLGDRRGADFLTSWLTGNYSSQKRDVIAEVINTIEHLGGETSELRKFLPPGSDSVSGH